MKKNKILLLFLMIVFLSFGSISFSDKDDFFSIILLPDTQYYSSGFPEIFYKQMDWIKGNKDLLNVQYVIHLGDITNNNKENAWQVASRSFKMLEDAGIPYSIVYGDNDMKNPDGNYYDGIRHTELLNKYFPVSRFYKPYTWWKGGFFEPEKIDNYFCLFEYKNYNFLIMNLEIAPRKTVLNWADTIISQYASREVIIVTHDYIDKNGERLNDLKSFKMDGENSKGKLKGNNAEVVYKKLVKKNSNVIMVLCGHKEGEVENEIKIKNPQEPEIKRKVIEILSDFQDERLKGSDEKSGKGLLRVLKIYPGKNKIAISTVSALTGKNKGDELYFSFGN